jgi:hypothetical protein
VWRGRLYTVRAILEHWIVNREWWQDPDPLGSSGPSAPDPAHPEPWGPSGPSGPEPAHPEPWGSSGPPAPEPPHPDPAQSNSAQSDSGQSRSSHPEPGRPEPAQPEPAQPEPGHPELEFWRVEASPGQGMAAGVYELRRDAASDAWTLRLGAP